MLSSARTSSTPTTWPNVHVRARQADARRSARRRRSSQGRPAEAPSRCSGSAGGASNRQRKNQSCSSRECPSPAGTMPAAVEGRCDRARRSTPRTMGRQTRESFVGDRTRRCRGDLPARVECQDRVAARVGAAGRGHDRSAAARSSVPVAASHVVAISWIAGAMSNARCDAAARASLKSSVLHCVASDSKASAATADSSPRRTEPRQERGGRLPGGAALAHALRTRRGDIRPGRRPGARAGRSSSLSPKRATGFSRGQAFDLDREQLVGQPAAARRVASVRAGLVSRTRRTAGGRQRRTRLPIRRTLL